MTDIKLIEAAFVTANDKLRRINQCPQYYTPMEQVVAALEQAGTAVYYYHERRIRATKPTTKASYQLRENKAMERYEAFRQEYEKMKGGAQ